MLNLIKTSSDHKVQRLSFDADWAAEGRPLSDVSTENQQTSFPRRKMIREEKYFLSLMPWSLAFGVEGKLHIHENNMCHVTHRYSHLSLVQA